MGPVEQAGSDAQAEADAFFGWFVDAAPEVVARVVAERGGDLAAVVEEGKAFGYWDRKIAARTARRVAREQAEAEERARIFGASALSRPVDEGARLVPLSEESAALLPAARVVELTGAERAETARWWRRLADPAAARGRARRVGAEVRDGERAARRAVGEAAAWRMGQRVFEREQYRAVIARRNARPQRRIANRWVAISEDRALAIALEVLEKGTPPQGWF